MRNFIGGKRGEGAEVCLLGNRLFVSGYLKLGYSEGCETTTERQMLSTPFSVSELVCR
jgi:hypothetical protein